MSSFHFIFSDYKTALSLIKHGLIPIFYHSKHINSVHYFIIFWLNYEGARTFFASRFWMTLSLPHNRTSSRGVAKVGDRFIIFLDLDRIFSAEEQELNIS